MPLKEIQRTGIRETSEITGFPPEIWSTELSHFEKLILDYQTYPYAEFPYKAAEELMNHIAQNGEFLIALVFNQDHTQVTAVPIPERFTTKNRIELTLSPHPIEEDIDALTIGIRTLLNAKTTDQNPDVLHNIIIVEQNLSEFRNKTPLVIGLWDSWKAKSHMATRHYDEWLRNEQQRLNHPSSGK